MSSLFRKLIVKNNKSQRGTTAVEFAIVIGVFLLIVFGIIEFGVQIYNHHIITNAGREGARAGIISREVRLNEEYLKNEVIKEYAEQYLISFSEHDWDNIISIKNLEYDNIDKCMEFNDRLEVKIIYQHSYFFLPFDGLPREHKTVMRCE